MQTLELHFPFSRQTVSLAGLKLGNDYAELGDGFAARKQQGEWSPFPALNWFEAEWSGWQPFSIKSEGALQLDRGPVLPFDAVVLNRRQRGDLEINVDIGTETVLYYGGGHWRYTSGEQTGQLGRVLCLAPLEHFTAEPPPFSEPGPLSRFSALAEQGHARDARQAI